jgi:hypothetical protein
MRRLFGLEAGAKSIRSYEGLIIPGLLQTEDYARALANSDIGRVRLVDAEGYIAARMRRQERMTGDDALKITAVISEAALTQVVGSVDILRRQLLHLAALMRNNPDKIDVRIILFSTPYRTIQSGSPFDILDFSSPVLPEVAWHESIAVHGIIDDPSKVRQLSILFARAHSTDAQSRADSLALIERTASELP